MCGQCESKGIDRRYLFRLAAAGTVAFGLNGMPWQAHAADGAATALSPAEALSALKSGNERYVSRPELCSIDLGRQRGAAAAPRAPGATLISCADSRVPQELIFGGGGVVKFFTAG